MRRRTAPWFQRLSPVTWALIWVLLVAGGSLAVRSFRRAQALPRSTEIEVLNGSGVADLAGSVAEFLRDKGLDVVSVGNADASHYPETLVLLRRGHAAVARMVAQRLGAGAPLQQLDPTLLVDVTVILGRDLVGRFAPGAHPAPPARQDAPAPAQPR